MGIKLFCTDIDGVLFHDRNFWMELHKAFGTLDEGKVLTEKYLKTDYARLVEEVVVKLWKGRDATPYFDLIESLEYIDGIKELFSYLHNQGFMVAVISASSLDVGRRIQREHGVDLIFANQLVIKEGKIAGEFVWPIAEGTEEKARILKDLLHSLKMKPEECIYIGDTMKDSEAFKIAGTSIAFNSESDELKQIATHVIDGDNLEDVVELLKTIQTS